MHIDVIAADSTSAICKPRTAFTIVVVIISRCGVPVFLQKPVPMIR